MSPVTYVRHAPPVSALSGWRSARPMPAKSVEAAVVNSTLPRLSTSAPGPSTIRADPPAVLSGPGIQPAPGMVSTVTSAASASQVRRARGSPAVCRCRWTVRFVADGRPSLRFCADGQLLPTPLTADLRDVRPVGRGPYAGRATDGSTQAGVSRPQDRNDPGTTGVVRGWRRRRVSRQPGSSRRGSAGGRRPRRHLRSPRPSRRRRGPRGSTGRSGAPAAGLRGRCFSEGR